MPINSFLYPGAKVVPPFTVANSCRFDDGSSDSMTRDNGTPTNLKKCSISLWFKRTEPGLNKYLIVGFDDESNRTLLQFSSDQLLFQNQTGGSNNTIIKSNAKFRDPSSWYHFCVIVDTTQSTDSNRVKMYVNGSQVTSLASSTYPNQNTDMELTDSANSILLNQKGDNSDYNSGYYAEVVVLDGTAASITDFGQFNEDTPTVWEPKDVTGLTFGNNGFYVDFEDSSNLGNDANGGTDFTVSNLTSVDQSTDTCTNNYAVLNSILLHDTAQFSEGNLKITQSSTDADGIRATIGVRAGKWYWEVLHGGGNASPGIATDSDATTNYIGGDTNGYSYFINGSKYTGGSASSYGASFTTGDIIGHALDMDNNQITFYKNGSSQGVAFTSLPDEFIFPAISTSSVSSVTSTSNFGQDGSFAGAKTAQGNSDANGYGNFYYSVPSGYYAINSKNLAEFG